MDRQKRTVLILRVALLAVLILVLAGLFFGSKRSSVALTKNPTPTATSAPASATAAPSSAPQPTTAPTADTKPPIPTGSVLNKTTISLSSTAPQTNPDMNSTCVTIVGGSCGLDLAGPSGQSKSIAVTMSDEQGGVNMNWNAVSLGLTQGTWRVRLVATYKGATSYGSYYQLEVKS